MGAKRVATSRFAARRSAHLGVRFFPLVEDRFTTAHSSSTARGTEKPRSCRLHSTRHTGTISANSTATVLRKGPTFLVYDPPPGGLPHMETRHRNTTRVSGVRPWWIAVGLVLSLAVSTGCSSEESLPTRTVAPDPSRVAVDRYGQLVSSYQIIAFFGDDVRDDEALNSARRNGATVVGRIPEIGLWQLEIENPDDDYGVLRERIAMLDSDSSVEHAFSNETTGMDLVPDDGLLNETIDYFWPLDMIRMPGAWDITTGDPDVSVGIVDGAFDTSHPEFLGDADAGLPSRICHYETVYPTASLPTEETEHGTHVAGIVGARGNNGQGIAGMDWRSCLRLYSTKPFVYFDDDAPEENGVVFYSSIMQGVYNAAADGVHAINLSMGVNWSSGNSPIYPYDGGQTVPDEAWLEEQADRWDNLLEYLSNAREGRGVLLVTSAGNNSNPGNSDPNQQVIDAKWKGGAVTLAEHEDYQDNILVVASVGNPDGYDTSPTPLFSDWADDWSRLSWFSNAGSRVDVAAPGASIISLAPSAGDHATDPSVAFMSGTSMAAPFVTGLASLLFSLDPELTAGEVKELIIHGAESGGVQVDGHSFYVINAAESLEAFDSQAPTLQWVRLFGDGGPAAGYDVVVSPAGFLFVGGHFSGTVDLDPSPELDERSTIGEWDIFISKLDSGGNRLWTGSFGGPHWSCEECGGVGDTLSEMATNADGDVVMTGIFVGPCDFDPSPGVDERTTDDTDDAFLTVFRGDGSYGWTRAIGSIGQEIGEAVAVSNDGSVYVAGTYNEEGPFDFDPGPGVDNHSSNGSMEVFLSSYSADGEYRWTRIIGGESLDTVADLGTADDGSVIVIGSFRHSVDFDPGPGSDVHTAPSEEESASFITKYSGNGDYEWTRSFDNANRYLNFHIAVLPDGSFFLVGQFRDSVDFDPGLGSEVHASNGNDDIFVSRYTRDGEHVWTRSIGGSGWDRVRDVAVDENEILYIVGSFENQVDFDPGPEEDVATAIGDVNAYIWRLSGAGEHLWVGTLHSDGGVGASGVAVDAQGTVFVTGSFTGTMAFEPEGGGETYSSEGESNAFVLALR